MILARDHEHSKIFRPSHLDRACGIPTPWSSFLWCPPLCSMHTVVAGVVIQCLVWIFCRNLYVVWFDASPHSHTVVCHSHVGACAHGAHA